MSAAELPSAWLNPDWRKSGSVTDWCKTYDAIEMMGTRLVGRRWRGYLADPDTAHARRMEELLHHWLKGGKVGFRLAHNYSEARRPSSLPEPEPVLWDPALGMEWSFRASTMGPAALKMSQPPYAEDGSGLRYAVSINREDVRRLLAAIDRPKGAPEGPLAKWVRKALEAGAKPTPAPVRDWLDKNARPHVRVNRSDSDNYIVIGDKPWKRSAFETAVRRGAERLGLR